MLLSNGCAEVSEAANGYEAEQAMRSEIPSLILCDINMSPGDGFKFLQDVRSGSFGPHDIPVVFLTCNVEKSIIERAIDLGVNGYLLKPVMAADLVAQISKVLTKANAPST